MIRRARIANFMRIIYTLYIGRPNTDVSYNAAWQGFWAYAEISLGLIVTCTLTLPRLVKAKDKQLRAVMSSISGPFGSSVRLIRFTSCTNNDAATHDKVATHEPHLGTELDPKTGDRSFEALRDVESWSSVSVNPID